MRFRPVPKMSHKRPLLIGSLWAAGGIYVLVRAYLNLVDRPPDLPRFTQYALLASAVLAFYCAFENYRNQAIKNSSDQRNPLVERFDRRDRIIFKALGAPPVLVGILLLGLSGWLACQEWIRLTQWPRINATVIAKDISSAGVRVLFRYEVDGRQITGTAFREGSESAVRIAVASYEPGTTHLISYNPQDPSQVEMVTSSGWELCKGPIVASLFGITFIVAGLVVYSWSHGSK